jgi:glutamyl/glutaminyl-tRNA synthetase
MAISHVLRGEEWLVSTAKHVLLYQASSFSRRHGQSARRRAYVFIFLITTYPVSILYHLFSSDLNQRLCHISLQALDLPTPKFAHLPLLRDTEKRKLSKRHGSVFVSDFAQQGILPSALVNFVALLGWAPGETLQESHSNGHEAIFLTMNELVQAFDLPQVNRAPAIVDRARLDFINAHHIRLVPTETPSYHFLRTSVASAAETYCADMACDGEKDEMASDAYLDAVLALIRPTYSTVQALVAGAGVFWVAPSETLYTRDMELLNTLFAKQRVTAVLEDVSEMAMRSGAVPSRAEWKRHLKAVAKSHESVLQRTSGAGEDKRPRAAFEMHLFANASLCSDAFLSFPSPL